METQEPTYEELRAERAREWAGAQAQAATALAELHGRLAAMPDVLHAPDPELPWSNREVACPCGGGTFLVTRWVTVNGLRHRAELSCSTCSRLGTWDWSEKRWI